MYRSVLKTISRYTKMAVT